MFVVVHNLALVRARVRGPGFVDGVLHFITGVGI